MKKIITASGRAVPIIGNNIDTDRIIPARFLKEITFNRMGEYPFYDERFDENGTEKDHPFNHPGYLGAEILLANANFGCGSSREHAPQSLFRWGIKAIVAESFAEIFSGNCTMLGVPTVSVSADNAYVLQKMAEDNPQAIFTLDLVHLELCVETFRCTVSMPETRRKALLEGTWDSMALLLANAEKVLQFSKRLP